MSNGKPYRQEPIPYVEQQRCCLGYVPRGAAQPARRPYDCKRGCGSLEECVGTKMPGYKKC